MCASCCDKTKCRNTSFDTCRRDPTWLFVFVLFVSAYKANIRGYFCIHINLIELAIPLALLISSFLLYIYFVICTFSKFFSSILNIFFLFLCLGGIDSRYSPLYDQEFLQWVFAFVFFALGELNCVAVFMHCHWCRRNLEWILWHLFHWHCRSRGDLFEVVNYQAVLGVVLCLKLGKNLVLKTLKIKKLL